MTMVCLSLYELSLCLNMVILLVFENIAWWEVDDDYNKNSWEKRGWNKKGS